MYLKNNQGLTLTEVLIATAIGVGIILAIGSLSGSFFKQAKNLEIKENTRVLIDKELMAMTKREELIDHNDIEKYAVATCSSLGLKHSYDSKTKKFTCMVQKYNGCKDKSPCLVDIKDSLCELQIRSKVTMRQACSL